MACLGCQKRRKQVHRIVESMLTRRPGYGQVVRNSSIDFVESVQDDMRRLRERMSDALKSNQTKRLHDEDK